MINIIPSIYVSGGKSVGVTAEGSRQMKIYSEAPLDVAKEYRDGGIKRIELIDLEGANSNSPVTFDLLNAIVSRTGLKVNYGGGIKSRESIRNAIDNGADKIICATIAATQPNVFSYWLDCFGKETMIFGADIREGKLVVRGRRRESGADLEEIIKTYLLDDLKYVEITDVARSGMSSGPATELYTAIAAKYPRVTLIAHGGIRNMDDIRDLQDKKIYNAVIGTAISEGAITLEDIQRFYDKTE